ncbi:MAG: polyphosphate:AMP phosphotransferase, partial [Pseudomonadota bacterium]
MPKRDEIGIFIDAWYAEPFMDGIDKTGEHELTWDNIRTFEAMLADDGAVIVKLFLHVSRDVQKMQLAEEAPRNLQNPRVAASPGEWKGKYKRAVKVANRMIMATDSAKAPWQAIRADHPYNRDVKAGRYLLQAMQRAISQADLSVEGSASVDGNSSAAVPVAAPAFLEAVDLDRALEKQDYREKLEKLQLRLQDLAWQARAKERSLIAVFEGWDAAGKGSAIRRVTQAIDPRLYRLVQYAAPTDEESAHHYLWRFWRHLARDGRCMIFDRSWYGRVLVERVEGFASDEEWRRAYEELRVFEWQLHDHGSMVIKFWLHISPEEQLKRFEERKDIPRKQHKITEEDWRNREKWPAYEQAVNDMIKRTNTDYAPWHIVAGNDKRYARIDILKALCKTLESTLA